MKKIEDYKIVEGSTIDILSAAVNREIKEGWQPFKIPFQDSRNFFQAMVKYEEESFPPIMHR